MQLPRIVSNPDSLLNAIFLVTLIPPTILKDYRLQKDGLYCIFKANVSHLRKIIETFLTALQDISGMQFFFEIINDQEAILKIYGTEKLQFSPQLMFNSKISSSEED